MRFPFKAPNRRRPSGVHGWTGRSVDQRGGLRTSRRESRRGRSARTGIWKGGRADPG